MLAIFVIIVVLKVSLQSEAGRKGRIEKEGGQEQESKKLLMAIHEIVTLIYSESLNTRLLLLALHLLTCIATTFQALKDTLKILESCRALLLIFLRAGSGHLSNKHG